jgi:MGT family glycosyltransferase
MRVLFHGIKGTGHVNPTLPLVTGLVAAGHEVFYTLTMEWKERISALGATFVNTGEGDAPFTTGDYHDGPFPLQLLPAAAAIVPRLLDDARRIAPDVIVYDSFAPWARVIAGVLKIPALCSVSMLVLSDAEMSAMFRQMPAPDERNTAASREIRERFGVDVSPSEIGRFFAPDNLAYSAETLNPGAATYPHRFHFVGPLLESAAPNAAADESLRDLTARKGKRRVYVSMGTILGDMMGLGVDFFRPFIDAFSGDPHVDVIVSVGRGLDTTLFGPVADNVFLRNWVPQAALLEHVDTFVTHAGANSMHEALFHGVPLVCIPGFGDQHVNAERLSELGAGITLASSEVTATTVRSSVDRVLRDTSFRASAEKLRAALRSAGGLEQALGVVTGLAGRER